MRVCWISALLLGLIHSIFISSSLGLEGEKVISEDEVYKPRKWSQVRDGPYRMVVSSRDQESEETQLDASKGTRARQRHDDLKADKALKNADASSTTPDEPKENDTNEFSKKSEDSESTAGISNSANETIVFKSRGSERRKHKVKYDNTQTSVVPQDNYGKNEKSTQRAITKLARKRERILINENFRKAHRVSIPEGYFSTSNPSTLSHKIYNHFRPIDHGIPRESIIPFYDFGKKLSTGKTPSGINSIEGSSTPGLGAYDITTHREDEDLYHEDMDVSVMKLRAVERNIAPKIRTPLKNPEITSYFQTSTGVILKEDEYAQSTTPLPESSTKDSVTTLQFSSSNAPSIDASVTIPTTMLPPEQSDLQINESKSKTNLAPSRRTYTTELPETVDVFSAKSNKTLEKLTEFTSPQTNQTRNTQLPRPSPTAKILSTAVVTSVSVKETYRHPRIKGMAPLEDVSSSTKNESSSESLPLKTEIKLNQTLPSPDSVKSTSKIKNTFAADIVPSTHRPSFDRLLLNRTVLQPKNNSTVQPTTIRPKFRSNIEFHTINTKVPSLSTTHKPLNRSLYSTIQREQQKNKFISSQHFKLDSSNRTLTTNQNSDNTTAKPDDQSYLNVNENKTKMYLTIRSRLPNQSATFRSTFRRNGTKPIPPVLRVIATPSSYIEVPRIISRLVQNSSATTLQPPTDGDLSNLTEPTFENKAIHPDTETIETSTDPVPLTTDGEVITLKPVQTAVEAGKIPDTAREVRMNNHRMSPLDVTTEEESVGEVTTIAVFHSLETTSETPEDRVPTQPAVTNDPINVITIAPRPANSKPGLSWVYLGQKNRSRVHESAVEVAYSSGFGIAAYVLAVLGVIPLILGGFVLLRQILIKSKKKMLDESEYSSEYNRTPLPAKLPRIPSHAANWEAEKATSSLSPPQQNSNTISTQHQNNSAPSSTQHQSTQHLLTQHQLQNGKWEFPRDKLRLQTLLGEGNFGQVWKAEADDISGHEGLTRLVAVKTVKEGSGGREREDLLRELAIMKELGSHPNVVTLLGCCTDREPFLLIMEYVMYGKMLTFLREHRTRAHYFNFSDLNSALVSRDLTVFAYCVARGMEFLVSKGIIHRDLAARNILVDHNKLCKIADFGMSRNVRDTGEIYEQRPNRGALPIRWMAPEALHCSVFTHKSDVWSFGILVWEIITLGCTPYQTMGAREVMRKVREGYRLDRPVHCTQDLYKVITRCWAADPSKRPTFTELKHDIATLLSDPQTNGACVDLDALTEEMSSHSC